MIFVARENSEISLMLKGLLIFRIFSCLLLFKASKKRENHVLLLSQHVYFIL